MATGPRELLSSSALDSEAFRIYCYKIVPCAKKFGHDWSECPFAHDGEKATRRCPALYRYSSIVCPEIRQSRACPRGDVCPYSHSIFEYWMHPARFRAQLCSFGTECNRRICFFAHTQEQLRTPSEPVVADALASRAPYLQGRVSPDSRFALYPEQVPALVPMPAGMLVAQQHQQQQQLLPQSDLGGGMPLQQVMYMPAGAPQAMAMAPAGAQQVAAGQQWAAGGSNMMFVPAGQAGGSAGMGYYVAGPAVASSGGGGDAASGISGGPGGAASYSAPMMVAPGMQVMGGGYGGQQPVQLMAAVAADGSMAMQQYPLARGGMPGSMMYAPMYPQAGPGGMQGGPWAAGPPPPQQQQQHSGPQAGPSPGQQQALQLLQVPEGADAAPGISRGGQDAFAILTPTGQLASSRGLAAAVEPQYAMMGPGAGLQRGPGVVSRPMRAAAGTGMVQQASPAGGAGGDGSHGAPGVDDIAQQMASWRMQ